MFRNALAAALRNLMRDRLYAAISIVGLAVGMAAAILTFLFVRDELTFDRFLPGHERIFVVMSHFGAPGRAAMNSSGAPSQVAGWLKQDVPEVQKAVRYRLQGSQFGGGVTLRHGLVETYEPIAWVDPDFFAVMRFKTVAGNPAGALARPDGLVLTRRMARKYFGKDAPLGEILEVNRQLPLRVMAVIEDPPSNSNITANLFASSRAILSPLAQADALPYRTGDFETNTRTYVQVAEPKQGAAAGRRLDAVIVRYIVPPSIKAIAPAGMSIGFSLVPLSQLHLNEDTLAETPSGSRALMYALSGLAALILVVAGVNFVNLMTARAARRGVEVGVRKAAGARRLHLMLQFLGESLLYAVAAMALAAALVELMLPALNGLLLRNISFPYWRDPLLLSVIVGLVLGMGSLAGLYPAVVLSAFRPATVLKGGLPQLSGSGAVRQGLVTAQFAILISLLLAVLVIALQTRFALNEGLRVDKDQVLRITTSSCRIPFVDALRHLPGVHAVACASPNAVGNGESVRTFLMPDGRSLVVTQAPVDFGFFELFRLSPVAGRLHSRAFGADAPFDVSPVTDPARPLNIVANEALAQNLASTPGQAVGMAVRLWIGQHATRPIKIVGVVPDFTFDLTKGPVKPTAFYIADPSQLVVINAKLEGSRLPETLAAIDGLWSRLGDPRPIRRRFTDEFLNTVYAGVIRQGWLVGALTGLAVFIGCLGLVGLAAFTAERRTKEIGVRKAMGASSANLVQLLLWQFTRPVLWATVIAWPLGWWAMDHWLHGFTYRIALSPWLFLAASGGALAIALITVSTHAVLVARAKPVAALRYE